MTTRLGIDMGSEGSFAAVDSVGCAVGSSLPGPWGASALERGCCWLLLLEEKKLLKK